ncbi:phosphoribosylformylglycinamidine synthase subunit PurQ [bacterium]|nr:phosphoribosylformylglycinamidine synthase subunit PurQ [bacterium]
MKIGIVVFPGSNCDYDCLTSFSRLAKENGLSAEVGYVWHKESNPGTFDAYVLPGGFSYGDYLRCGAIARFSPIMEEVTAHAKKGRPVIGICNGFQILCESGLLPGALYMNRDLNFICEHVFLRTERSDTIFTSLCKSKEVLNIPIAHGEGNYYADDETLKKLEDEELVAFRYCTGDGLVTPEVNPNGSRNNIAGIFNKERTILGMMPHPERAAEPGLGSSDGQKIIVSLLKNIAK